MEFYFADESVHFQHARPHRRWCCGGERNSEGGHTFVRAIERGKRPCPSAFPV